MVGYLPKSVAKAMGESVRRHNDPTIEQREKQDVSLVPYELACEAVRRGMTDTVVIIFEGTYQGLPARIFLRQNVWEINLYFQVAGFETPKFPLAALDLKNHKWMLAGSEEYLMWRTKVWRHIHKELDRPKCKPEDIKRFKETTSR